MDARAKELISIGDAEFNRRSPVLSLWQSIAENFYPERADFTTARNVGQEFASDLTSSYPVIAHRELSNLFASLLRPRSTPWFQLSAADEALNKDNQARAWMEYASGVQWRAMYDPASQFVRATKEGDRDFAAFGNAVISAEPNANRDGLLYRSYHLRDVAWSENQDGKIDICHLKLDLTARQLAKLFPKTIDPKVKECLSKEPEKKIKCRRIVVPSDMYEIKGRKLPFVSVYIDEDNEKVLEEIHLGWFPFVIPRWVTISGSSIARSMATDIVLPDARTLQAMTRVLLEAGEKAVDPPLVATQDVIRSDMGLYAGGVTWVDSEYDERLGDALRPLGIETGGIPLGMEMSNQIQAAINKGFFLDKLGLPEMQMKEMTAYEVQKRIEEHIREAAPLFEPIEDEYNAPLCNLTFEILRANGAFGPLDTVPESLRGSEVQFTFDSPLREIGEELKGKRFVEGLNLTSVAAQIDPAQVANIRMTPALRDSLRGIGWDAEWLEDEEAVDALRAQQAEKAQMQEAAQALDTGAEIAGKTGKAAQDLQAAGIA